MNKFEMMRQCGALVGLRFQAAPDSATPEMVFEITRQGLRDKNGFLAVELTFPSGKTEIAAVEILRDGVENRGLRIL